MKAMYKYEIADRAGVTTKTLRRWLKPYKTKNHHDNDKESQSNRQIRKEKRDVVLR